MVSPRRRHVCKSRNSLTGNIACLSPENHDNGRNRDGFQRNKYSLLDGCNRGGAEEEEERGKIKRQSMKQCL